MNADRLSPWSAARPTEPRSGYAGFVLRLREGGAPRPAGSGLASGGWASVDSYCWKVMDSSETNEKSFTAGSRGLIRVICPFGLMARSA